MLLGRFMIPRSAPEPVTLERSGHPKTLQGRFQAAWDALGAPRPLWSRYRVARNTSGSVPSSLDLYGPGPPGAFRGRFPGALRCRFPGALRGRYRALWSASGQVRGSLERYGVTRNAPRPVPGRQERFRADSWAPGTLRGWFRAGAV